MNEDPFSNKMINVQAINGKGAAMACVRSTKLSDGELLAYLAGDADAAVTTHLAACDECQQRAAALATLEQRLTATLYRLECPSSLALGEYQLGLLSAAATRTIATHLQHCPHCTNEITMLTSYLTQVAPTLEREPAPRLVERTRVLVARLVEELSTLGIGSGLAVAPAGLRGAAGDQLVYEADGVQVIIDVEADGQHPAQRVLLGLLLGITPPQTITAYLWRMEQSTTESSAKPVATTTVDELGNFVIDNLAPGAYDLILSSEKTEVHIAALSI